MIEQNTIFTILAIFIVLIILLYQFGKRNQNLHKRIGYVGPSPWPYFGNLLQFIKIGLYQFDVNCLKKYGKIYPFYIGGIPMIVVADEELLKSILIKDAKCFIDRFDSNIDETTKKFITRLKGKDWERVRSIISPTFTSGKLKKMSPMICDCVTLLQDRMKELENEPSIDMKEIFGALTMDVISRTMFGMEIDSQKNPNNKFIVYAKKLFSISIFNVILIFILLFPSFGRFLSRRKLLKGFSRKTMDFFRTTVSKAIEERKKSTEVHNDFLALMLKEEEEEMKEEDKHELEEEVKYQKGTKRLSMEEIVAQSMVFLLAGYETTATTLSFATYFLAKNPDVQEQVYEELISQVSSPDDLSYDILMKLPLLDAVISETLRFCPPAVQLNRLCTQSIVLTTSTGEKLFAQKDDIFTIPVYAIHHDPELWPEPEKFDIHRFDQDVKKDRSPYAYMPFGMGPRNCVGMRFALLEVKWALASIMLKFQFLACEETMEKLEFKPSGLLGTKKPIKLKILSRSC